MPTTAPGELVATATALPSATNRLIAAGVGAVVLSATVGFVNLSRQTTTVVHGKATAVATQISAYRPVTIAVDGRQQIIHTAAATVQGAVADAGIDLGADDTVSPAVTEPVNAGQAIEVTRLGEHTATEKRPVPHNTIEQTDPQQYIGIDKVITQGTDGAETVTYQVMTVNGVETSRTQTSAQVTTPPVDTVVAKGSKQFPANINALNWQALGKCESTNNPKAVNKTNGKYFGEYQFSVETWAGVGGTGNPADASAAEQLARAKILFMKYGAGQWECGSHLYD